MNLIVLDWDNTLLPTNYLENRTTLPFTEKEHQELEILDQEIIETIEVCMSIGQVILLTNATTKWILNSSFYFLPRTFVFLNQIEIISAKEENLNSNVDFWKEESLRKRTENSNVKNLISLGDSQYERIAVLRTNAELKKIVTIQKQNNIVQLTSLIKTFKAMIPLLYSSRKSLDLTIEYQCEIETLQNSLSKWRSRRSRKILEILEKMEYQKNCHNRKLINYSCSIR